MQANRAIGGLAVLAVLAAGMVWVAGGRAIAVEAAYPAERAVDAASRSFRARWRAVWSRQSQGAELAALRRKADELEVVRQENSRLATENARLREALGYPAAHGGGWIAAPVLGRNGTEGVRGFLRAGKGSNDGVKAGAPVVSKDGVVGRVEATTPHTATIRLLSDPSVRIACEIETVPEASGAVRGIVAGGAARRVFADDSAGVVYLVNPFRLDHVRPDAVCAKGAKVVTSGLGGVFPAGLAIGRLVDAPQASGNDSGLEKTALVAPAVDFAALEDVFIQVSS